jgi:hypothetical protein
MITAEVYGRTTNVQKCAPNVIRHIARQSAIPKAKVAGTKWVMVVTLPAPAVNLADERNAGATRSNSKFRNSKYC